MNHKYNPKKSAPLVPGTQITYLRGSKTVTGHIVEPLTDGKYLVRPLHKFTHVKIKAKIVQTWLDLQGAPPPPPPKPAPMGMPPCPAPRRAVPPVPPSVCLALNALLQCLDKTELEVAVPVVEEEYPGIIVWGEIGFYCVGRIRRGKFALYKECNTYRVNTVTRIN